MPKFFRFLVLVTFLFFLCPCGASPPPQGSGKKGETSSSIQRPSPVGATETVLPLPKSFNVSWKKVTLDEGCPPGLKALPNITKGVIRGKISYYWAFVPKAQVYKLPKDKNRKEYKFKFHYEPELTKKAILTEGGQEVSIASGSVKETTDGDYVAITARSSLTENFELRVVQLVGTLTYKDPGTQAEKIAWWWSAGYTPTFVAMKVPEK